MAPIVVTNVIPAVAMLSLSSCVTAFVSMSTFMFYFYLFIF